MQTSSPEAVDAFGLTAPLIRDAVAADRPATSVDPAPPLDLLREFAELGCRVRLAIENGEPVTGEALGQWQACSHPLVSP